MADEKDIIAMASIIITSGGIILMILGLIFPSMCGSGNCLSISYFATSFLIFLIGIVLLLIDREIKYRNEKKK